MNPLDQARQSTNFDTLTLSHFIWDGPERYDRFQAFQKLLDNDPLLRNDPKDIAIGRPATYELYARKMKRVMEIANLKDIKEFATPIFPEALVSSLNYEMFMPTILNLGTPEQIKLFYEPASRWEIIGCYSQTELAHGSDVNNLETTAIYDKSTREFIIHTPNLGATKWWGSDMGLTATHVVTQAQLFVDGKKHGIQIFVVPIRCMKTHQALPGILVGDIGAKFGFNSKDNGYLRFDHVRVPKVNMLSKYSQLDEDGNFRRIGDDKIWHASMYLMRQHLLDTDWKYLGQGLMIAVRYGIQRKQFKNSEGIEISIFDYQLQQQKLIPLIAEMYGCICGSKAIYRLANDNYERIQKNNDNSRMMEVHVALSTQKAIQTWNCFFGMEKIRQCIGGHGYSQYSGIPQIITEMSPSVTAEGENTVLSLSAAKGILMLLEKAIKTGKAPNSTLDYLENILEFTSSIKQPIQTLEDCNNPIKVRELLKYCVSMNVVIAMKQLTLLRKQGQSFKSSTDKHLGILLNEITRSHSNYWTMRIFFDDVSQIKDISLKSTLNKVCQLYGLNKLLEQIGQLFQYRLIEATHITLINQARDALISELKQQALGLVESLGYDDNALKSAIGQSNGQPYETLFKWANESNPVNHPSFQEEIFNKIQSTRTTSLYAKL